MSSLTLGWVGDWVVGCDLPLWCRLCLLWFFSSCLCGLCCCFVLWFSLCQFFGTLWVYLSLFVACLCRDINLCVLHLLLGRAWVIPLPLWCFCFWLVLQLDTFVSVFVLLVEMCIHTLVSAWLLVLTCAVVSVIDVVLAVCRTFVFVSVCMWCYCCWHVFGVRFVLFVCGFVVIVVISKNVSASLSVWCSFRVQSSLCSLLSLACVRESHLPLCSVLLFVQDVCRANVFKSVSVLLLLLAYAWE